MSAVEAARWLIGQDKATITLWQTAARGVIVFAVGLAMIRLAGARAFTRGSPLETIVAVLIGSNLSRALAGTASFWGMIGVSILILMLHSVVAHLTVRSKRLSTLIKRPPVVLARDGVLDRAAMQKEAVDAQDVEASLREEGMSSLDQAAVATLERDGRISLVRRS